MLPEVFLLLLAYFWVLNRVLWVSYVGLKMNVLPHVRLVLWGQLGDEGADIFQFKGRQVDNLDAVTVMPESLIEEGTSLWVYFWLIVCVGLHHKDDCNLGTLILD